jgi:hypothetical protein
MRQGRGSMTAPLEEVDLVVDALDNAARPTTGEVAYDLVHPPPPWSSRNAQSNATRFR